MTYYKTVSRYYDSGAVDIAYGGTVHADSLPNMEYYEYNRLGFDLYIDYFNTEEQARSFIDNTLKQEGK